VVQELDPEQHACVNQAVRQCEILRARVDITARVAVTRDDCRRVGLDGGAARRLEPLGVKASNCRGERAG
jgi:hypothetical protein